ncbi:LEAF RUST 10 DISEASE-RESISTANCE LOCUS RECEPTOR-LIKE PROTEIN KINASE-like 2.1 [Tasmannia lanceolata]|uniref:LEAF RUST 10 DISEASE-RESISTANCE LOCUS RECEPTOR-LIKE PROTEIN KINASE-like 2.1 n=1 Tax=Tasmannia lanceolata TaxID=3420 RepID=UPI004063A813
MNRKEDFEANEGHKSASQTAVEEDPCCNPLIMKIQHINAKYLRKTHIEIHDADECRSDIDSAVASLCSKNLRGQQSASEVISANSIDIKHSSNKAKDWHSQENCGISKASVQNSVKGGITQAKRATIHSAIQHQDGNNQAIIMASSQLLSNPVSFVEAISRSIDISEKLISEMNKGKHGSAATFSFSSIMNETCIRRMEETKGTLISFLLKNKRQTHDIEAFIENYQSLTPKRYKYSELKNMTNSFKDELGEGGFGRVFKGKLRDGRLVAVKVMREHKDYEVFINEVTSISRTDNVNIVSLLGFCMEGSNRALIYEFMPNGSLEKFIFSEKPKTLQPLAWEKLYQIALGIARGLDYLHHGCRTHILHLNIKPGNILLEQDFLPKISDFGLAKLCPIPECTISISSARGTRGLMEPEWFYPRLGRVSHKSDVYSYGMMLLEMVRGRSNFDLKVANSRETYFPLWIYGRMDQPGDIGLGEFVTEAENETARKMILVALWCIQIYPANRPSMSDVVEMLEGSIEDLQVPPKPFISSPLRILIGSQERDMKKDDRSWSMVCTDGSTKSTFDECRGGNVGRKHSRLGSTS